MREADVSQNRPKKGPFFENLKNINPKYCLIGNGSARKASRSDDVRRKSDTFIVDKGETFSASKGDYGDLRSECNKENDHRQNVHDEPNLENSITLSECNDNSLSQTQPTISNDDHTETFSYSDGDIFHSDDTETCNDDIVIFERTEYKSPKAQAEETKKITRPVTAQKVLYILGISLTILLLIWSIVRLKEVNIFVNYFKIKEKPQPTNYEISLLFVNNVCRLISSGVDNVRDVWLNFQF